MGVVLAGVLGAKHVLRGSKAALVLGLAVPVPRSNFAAARIASIEGRFSEWFDYLLNDAPAGGLERFPAHFH